MALNVHQESKSEVEWNPSQERLIVVSNRLPFVLKRDDVTGKLVRKSRQVEFYYSFRIVHIAAIRIRSI